jgi:hypothetical protein
LAEDRLSANDPKRTLNADSERCVGPMAAISRDALVRYCFPAEALKE